MSTNAAWQGGMATGLGTPCLVGPFLGFFSARFALRTGRTSYSAPAEGTCLPWLSLAAANTAAAASDENRTAVDRIRRC